MTKWPAPSVPSQAAQGSPSYLAEIAVSTFLTRFQLDSAPPKVDLGKFVRNEARFRLVEQQDPERFKALLAQGQDDIRKHFAVYDALARRGTEPPVTAG